MLEIKKIIDLFKNSFYIAYVNLTANKMRSFLTMLGIVIGIASVIIIMAVGAGAQSLILNQIKSVGTNLIGILPGGQEEEGPPAAVMGIVITTLKYEDGLALAKSENVEHVEAVSSYVRGIKPVTWRAERQDANIMGVSADYVKVEDTDVQAGRFFTFDEEKGAQKLAVIGPDAKENLFGLSDPIGENIKIRRETFKVIGVMKPRGTSGFMSYDDQILVPVTTAQKFLLGIKHISFMRVKVDNLDYLDQSLEQVKQTLRERHNIDNPSQDDFSARTIVQGIEAFTEITNSLKYFLTSIAAIALFVGGIGIMNIMLIAVNERIKEIGLRKAVGAKTRDVLVQFLMETVAISLFGGVLGIFLGAIISVIVAIVARSLDYNWDLVISINSILLAVGVSSLVGLIFGIYPAKKAAKFSPVEALRYE